MGKTKKQPRLIDDHEGLSENQCRLILSWFNLDYIPFAKWIVGQTCPMIHRSGKEVIGVYEYDLHRYILWKKRGIDPEFD